MSTIPRLPIVLGLILSAYAVYVEYRHATSSANPEDHFTALCDIEALNASCSNVFALPQGRMLSYFGLVPEGSALDWPNAALGLFHYTVMLFWKDALPGPLLQFEVLVSFASTVFLAYQLTFVVPELCVLCWSTHVINTYVLYRGFFSKRKQSSSMKTIKRV